MLRISIPLHVCVAEQVRLKDGKRIVLDSGADVLLLPRRLANTGTRFDLISNVQLQQALRVVSSKLEGWTKVSFVGS